MEVYARKGDLDIVKRLQQIRREIIEYFKFIRGNLLVLTSSEIISHITNNIASPFLSLYIIALGGTTTTIGQINASASLSRVFTRIPGGYIADKFGRKKIIISMCLATAFINLLYVFAVDWTWIMLASILHATTAIYVPAYKAMLADSIPPGERGKAYVLTHLLPQTSIIIAPYIGAVLIDHFSLDRGIRIGYSLSIFGTICATYIRAMFLKETLTKRTLAREGSPKNLRILTSLKSIKGLLIFRSIFMATTIMLQPLYIVYATNVTGLTINEWGLIISSSIAISVILSFPVGYLSDRYRRKIILILLFQILTFGIFLFPFCTSFLTVFLSYLIILLTRTFSRSILQAIEADSVRKDMRGRIFSMIDVATFSISIPLSLFAGMAYDSISPEFPFRVGALLILISSFLLIIFFRESGTKEG